MADEAKAQTDGEQARALLKPIYIISSIALVIVFLGGSIALASANARFIGLVVVWLVSGVACGAFLGLLFGVPKRNRDGKNATAAGANINAKQSGDASPTPLGYGGNSNFEEISDWLTKVIVGATLVGLQGALRSVWQLAKSLLPFGDHDPAAGASLVVGAAATGLVGGFISMYLWARNELPNLFDGADQPRDGNNRAGMINKPRPETAFVEMAEPEIPAHDGDANADGLPEAAAAATTFRPIGQAPWLSEMKGMSRAQIWDTDFNKGEFGGSCSTATRILSAVVGKTTDKYADVTLTVRSTDPVKDPLKGRVTFYLHPTFYEPIIKVDAANSQAQTELCTADAFVVGVECDDGRTVLELDLATVDGFPASLR